jgi:hypothetical protein
VKRYPLIRANYPGSLSRGLDRLPALAVIPLAAVRVLDRFERLLGTSADDLDLLFGEEESDVYSLFFELGLIGPAHEAVSASATTSVSTALEGISACIAALKMQSPRALRALLKLHDLSDLRPEQVSEDPSGLYERLKASGLLVSLGVKAS